MDQAEEKRRQIRELIDKDPDKKGAANLARLINQKTGASIAATTITRAANNDQSSDNMLHLIYYALTN